MPHDDMPLEDIYRISQKVVRAHCSKNHKNMLWISGLLGTKEKTFYSMLDPNQPNATLSINKIIEITKLTSDTRIIEAIAHEAGMLAIQNTQVTVTLSDINALTDMANIEGADVFKEVKLALADGEITQDEKNIALKEIKEAQEAYAALENNVKNLKVKED